MHDRRTLLRGLASLPLIGGSVAILGQPTRVARATTDEQLAQYSAFAFNEVIEIQTLFQGRGIFHQRGLTPSDAMERHRPQFPSPDGIYQRAAIVLSAVGCPLTGERDHV